MVNNIYKELFIAAIFFLLGVIIILYAKKNRKINLINLAAFIYLVSFSFGAILSYLNGRTIQNTNIELLLLGYGSVFIFCLGLYLISFIFNLFKTHNKLDYTKIFNQYNSISLKSKYLIGISSFLLSFGVLNAYQLTTYGSGTAEKALSIPYPLLVASSLANIVFMGIIISEIRNLIIRDSRKQHLLFLIMLVLFVFTNLRSRSTIFSLFIYAFFFFLLYNQKLNLQKGIIILFIVFALFQYIFPFIIGFREVQKELAHNQSELSFWEISNTAIRQAANTNLEEMQQSNSENLEFRSYYMEANLFWTKKSNNNHMDGLLLKSGFLGVIPRILYPDKFKDASGVVSEASIFNYYKFWQGKDMADNLPFYGYIDFGLMGSLLAGIILGFILLIIQKIAFMTVSFHPIVSISILARGLTLITSVENNYLGYFSTFRDILIFTTVAYIYYTIKRNRY